MVFDQTNRGAVNKKIMIGFLVTTTDGTSTAVINAAALVAAGATNIRDIHLKCTGDKAYLGFDKDAEVLSAGAANVVKDVVPVFINGFFNKSNCGYSILNVIRAVTTNVTVEGYVVVS